jgi:hypothetical protein
MSANKQHIFTLFSGHLHVGHTRTFSGNFGKFTYFICRKQEISYFIQYYRSAVSAYLLLMLVFVSPILTLSGSCVGYLPVKKQPYVCLSHKDTMNDLKTVYKVISKPVFCFYNNSRLAFLGKNNLE